MTIPKEAIDAAAEALFDEAQELDQENSWGDPLPDEWRESWRDAAREAIEAALPHLREQIAQEIEAEQYKIESTHHIHGTVCLCGFDSNRRARSVTEHITQALNAAQIVRGE